MISASQIDIIPFQSDIFQDINIQSCFHALDIKKSNIVFNGGASATALNIYDSIKDVKISNDSLIMLSKHKKLNDIFEETKKHKNIKKLIGYTSLKLLYRQEAQQTTGFFRNNGSITTKPIIHKEEKEIFKYISVADNNIILEDNILNNLAGIYELFFEEDWVYLVNKNKKALTQNNNSLYFSFYNKSPDQKFNYILNNTSIILFEYNSMLTKAVTFNLNTSEIYFSNTTNSIPQNSIIYIERLKDLIEQNTLTESFIAKYKTNALSANNTINIDKDTQKLNYQQEFLINIPYKNKNAKVYINSLKNYQTPSYEYSLGNDITNRREYSTIFTGINKESGHKNIYLNFNSNTLEKVFKKDSETVFHYPATVPTTGVYLSAAGLIEDGAIAGANPFTSDRVGYNRSDYRDLNLPSPSSTISDNTWQYAWLSAGNNGEVIWMDRHYFGAYYELSTQDYLLYTVRDPLIADVPSTMLFLPNRIYSYYHQGFDNIKKYTQNFNSIERDKSSKILEITAWDSQILKDNSIYNNNGTLCLNTTIQEVDNLKLNGVNYVIFPASESMSESRQLTVGFWFNVDDWTNFEGNQIFGNYSSGGYGLFNKKNISTSFFTVYESINNYVFNLNSELNLIGEAAVNSTSATSTLPVYILRTSDYNTWLINSNNFIATKHDLNNNIIIDINLKNRGITNISQVEIDGDENIYVFDKFTKLIIKFDSYTGEVLNNEFQGSQNFNFTNNFNRIEIVKNYSGSSLVHRQGEYSVVGLYAEQSIVDNYKNIWSSVGVNLYKNNILFASIGKIEQLSCDTKDNLWVLHDGSFLTKIETKTNNIVFTKQITNNNVAQKLFINFISIKQDKKEKDSLIVINSEENTISILDLDNANVIDNISLLVLPSAFIAKRNNNRNNIKFTAYGDFTGYQLQRKFNTAQELVWRVNVTDITINTNFIEDYKTLEMPFTVANFEYGWHYFNFVFDHSKGYTAAYVDGVEVSRLSFNPFELLIKPTKRPFCLGAVTTEQGILNDTVGINDKNKTIGQISNLHIYKYAFDMHDINCLFKSTFKDMYKDLVWNINIGKRNYIEQIEKFFKHTMPGNKTNFYNIKIKNFPATEEQKAIIEQAIKDTIKKITPADTTLHKIKWEY